MVDQATPTADNLHLLSHQARSLDDEVIRLITRRSGGLQNDLVRHTLKRMLDVCVSAALIVLLSPVLLMVATLVALTSRGPVLFGSHRVGQGGRHFEALKFRTMRIDGAERLELYFHHHPEARAEFATAIKLKQDPRITPIGRILRATSLDELPQLYNVLVGQMSLVGPRPILIGERDLYGSMLDGYLSARPGITGPWQVSGRNDLPYDQRVLIQAAYAESLSLRNDLLILVRTLVVVFRRSGAY